jgi:hypothetical protein
MQSSGREQETAVSLLPPCSRGFGACCILQVFPFQRSTAGATSLA